MKIVTAPEPVLSQKAKPVNKVNKSIQRLIEEMKKTLLTAKDPVGVGLAAPQVGKSLQIFIAKPSDKSPFTVFINPSVTVLKELTTETPPPSKKKPQMKLEGCLSLPAIWGEVSRHPFLRVSYLNEKGQPQNKSFKGFIATIIQHEMDHLNGVLFPKRVLDQKGSLFKSKKGEKGEDTFHEIEI
ncbi:peptide deformylase [Patescibacteria group bacterium]|nr:peptide deformylase [Patescibacteria group bacterium]